MSPFDAALPSTEDLFSVIEAIHDNVAIVDHNGVMRWVSSCFERNYGISRDRVIGRTTYELEAEKVFSPSVAALVLKTRRVVTLTEATRSGQYNIVTGVPIYDDDGDVSFVVSYSVDMRYSRRLHEEYQKISALGVPECAPNLRRPAFQRAHEGHSRDHRKAGQGEYDRAHHGRIRGREERGRPSGAPSERPHERAAGRNQLCGHPRPAVGVGAVRL